MGFGGAALKCRPFGRSQEEMCEATYVQSDISGYHRVPPAIPVAQGPTMS